MDSVKKIQPEPHNVTSIKTEGKLEQICTNLQGKNKFQLDMANAEQQANSQEELMCFLQQNAAQLARFYCSFICPNRLHCGIARKNYNIDPIDEPHTYFNIRVIPFSQDENEEYTLS